MHNIKHTKVKKATLFYRKENINTKISYALFTTIKE